MFSQRKNRGHLLLFLTLMFFSCNGHEQHLGKSINQHDSVAIAATNLSKPATDENFTRLKGYFTKDRKGRIDSLATIPFQLLNHYSKDNIDTTAYVSINPISWIGNKYGSFSIIKANCPAGGACAKFYMLFFDKGAVFKKIITLGMLAAEESNSVYFEYKIVSDTSLETYEINYDEEKDMAIDTVIKKIRLAL